MAKTPVEKAIEKQIKQAKDAERKREQEARQAVVRERAASVVSGQPLIAGFRVMDATAEEVLKCLLSCKSEKSNHIAFGASVFPEYAQRSMGVELEKLVLYGMIGGLISYDGGGWCDILPPAIVYFENKEKALHRQEEERATATYGSITNFGNIVFGNVSNSTLSVDNSIREIERKIDEYGGDDKAELFDLLEEIKELLDNIQTSRNIPKQKKLFQKISDHVAKHGWFYGAVVQLLGTATMTMLGA